MADNKGVRVFDNGGETVDRYTVVIDQDVYGMSSNPFGEFNQYNFTMSEGMQLDMDKLEDKEVAIIDLPENVIKAICDRMLPDGL